MVVSYLAYSSSETTQRMSLNMERVVTRVKSMNFKHKEPQSAPVEELPAPPEKVIEKMSNEKELSENQHAEITRARSLKPPESWPSISKRLGIPYLAKLGEDLPEWTQEDEMQLRGLFKVERQELIGRITAGFQKENIQEEIIEDHL